jgi:hypothetical protein
VRQETEEQSIVSSMLVYGPRVSSLHNRLIEALLVYMLRLYVLLVVSADARSLVIRVVPSMLAREIVVRSQRA